VLDAVLSGRIILHLRVAAARGTWDELRVLSEDSEGSSYDSKDSKDYD